MKKFRSIVIMLVLTLTAMFTMIGCGKDGSEPKQSSSDTGDKNQEESYINKSTLAEELSDHSMAFPAFEGKKPIIIPDCDYAEISPDRKHVVYITANRELYIADADLKNAKMIAQLPAQEDESEKTAYITNVGNKGVRWSAGTVQSGQEVWYCEYDKEPELLEENVRYDFGTVVGKMNPGGESPYDEMILITPDREKIDLGPTSSPAPSAPLAIDEKELDPDGEEKRSYLFYADMDQATHLTVSEKDETTELWNTTHPERVFWHWNIDLDGDTVVFSHSAQNIDTTEFYPEKNYMAFRFGDEGDYVTCNQSEYFYYDNFDVTAVKDGFFLPVVQEDIYDLHLGWCNEKGEFKAVTPLQMEGRHHLDSYLILDDNHFVYYGRDNKLHLAKVNDGVMSEDKVIYDMLVELNEEEGFKYVPAHLPEQKVFVFTDSVSNYLMDYDGEKKVVLSTAGQMELVDDYRSTKDALAVVHTNDGDELWKINVKKAMEVEEGTTIYDERESLGKKIADHVVKSTISSHCRDGLYPDNLFFYTKTEDGKAEACFYNGKKVVSHELPSGLVE